jgi:hypothetical protein
MNRSHMYDKYNCRYAIRVLVSCVLSTCLEREHLKGRSEKFTGTGNSPKIQICYTPDP